MNIIDRQPNRDPYLFLTEEIHFQSEDRAVCRLCLSCDLWYFKVHWPGNENMPAALQIEAMTQLGGLILLLRDDEAEYIYIRKISNSIFYRKILPEQVLFSEVEIVSQNRGIYCMKGVIRSEDGTRYSKSEFSLINPKEIEQFER